MLLEQLEEIGLVDKNLSGAAKLLDLGTNNLLFLRVYDVLAIRIASWLLC
jgi:hypothetical protein